MKTISLLLMIIFLLISSLAFAMQASSDIKPAKFVKSRGKTQVNYNIHQVDVKDIDGKSRKIWQYEYVEIEGPVTKAKFKEALRRQELEKEGKGKPSWSPDEVKTEYEKEKVKNSKHKVIFGG